MLYDWSGFMPKVIQDYLGPYLNILPLVTIVLFLLQQRMFMPEARNEQEAMQQKVMTYVMIFMGVLFYKVPSGLCVYFIASSLWGIAERKLIPPPKADLAAIGDSDPLPTGGVGDKRGNKNGRSGGRPTAKGKRNR
jgi:YidC/Oxa1 family membrane protein insertase